MDRFVAPRATLPTDNILDTIYRIDSTNNTIINDTTGLSLPPLTIRTTTTTNPTTATPNTTTTNGTTVNILPTSSVRTGQALDLWVNAAASRANAAATNATNNGQAPTNFFRNTNTTLNDTYNQSTTAWVSGASPSMRRTHGQLLQRELLNNNNTSSISSNNNVNPLLYDTNSISTSNNNEAYLYTNNNDEESASAGSNRTLSSATITANAMNRVLNQQLLTSNLNSQGHITFLSRSDNIEEGYDDNNNDLNNSNIANIENLDASFAAAGGRPFALPLTTTTNNTNSYSSSITNSPMRSPLHARILQVHGSGNYSSSSSSSPFTSGTNPSSFSTSNTNFSSSSSILPTLSSALRNLSSSATNPNSLDHIRSLALSPLRAQASSLSLSNSNSTTSSSSSIPNSPNRYKRRHVGKVPYKVLDAPALADDFYLNLLDWSSQNILVVGLGSDVYMWNAYTAKVTKLANVGTEDAVTSVAWTQKGGHVAIGTDKGTVQIWDATQAKLVRTMTGHTARVGSLSWAAHTLATGGRDKSICIRDVRAKTDVEHRLVAHKQEVCGLKWSPDWSQLASGGNDNRLLLWSLASMNGGNGTHNSNGDPTSNVVPLMKFTQHTAAIKALAWSPHRAGLLASGGGTSDKCIRFFNTNTGLMEQVIDTGSQVCQLEWSPYLSELVSCHGYSTNSVTLWRYPDMNKIATLSGHTTRVLYMAISPDGQSIVTGAGDETLRFWYVFPPTENTNQEELPSSLLLPSSSKSRTNFNNNPYASPIMDIR